jgi:hypothetical protein
MPMALCEFLTGARRTSGIGWFRNTATLVSGVAEKTYFFAPAAAGAGADFWKLYVPPNFLLNRSTRPAVSTNFCFPVKNGWQALQIST